MADIQDHGIGIPEASRQNIFQAFTQADTSVTRRFGGSGLGLHICKRLAELMEGKIWFESSTAPLEHGTTFYFTIIVQKQASYDLVAVVALWWQSLLLT
jgi:signal transduction histidine kinase